VGKHESVAWITGAGTGIGRSLALELARRGYRVALSGRREQRLREVATTIESAGGQPLLAVCDVRDQDQQRRAAEALLERWGRLDIAVANAGFSMGGRIEELNAEDWFGQLDTNVVGAALTARASLPALRRTRGRLALVGSVSAFFSAPGHAPYHASKYAIRALGRTLSAELVGTGVSCTTVHPGFVQSDIQKTDHFGDHDPRRTDPRPGYLMWPTERAARVIVDAIVKRRRELVFTGHGRFAAFVGTHWPGLAHFVMTRGAMRDQADTFRSEVPSGQERG
jgi:NAD(P)-dependent dehydrogenase (short-subunit alcohol dehydrogenase family)